MPVSRRDFVHSALAVSTLGLAGRQALIPIARRRHSARLSRQPASLPKRSMGLAGLGWPSSVRNIRAIKRTQNLSNS
jgi:hypothetical protein